MLENYFNKRCLSKINFLKQFKILFFQRSYAGVIEKVELTNFMCHANLVLDLNPRVNFVVGKNGSGKSAIMTGLMVVLGTRAADTSRGRSLSAFVRMGCSQAKIRIVLSNGGLCAFKPKKYGNKITLTRTINGNLAN